MRFIGFEKIFAFEPNVELVHPLIQEYHTCADIQIFPFAISSSNGSTQLHLFRGKKALEPKVYDHLSSLEFHEKSLLPDFLEYHRIETVPMRSLSSLIQDKILPSSVGFLKVDTEGHDFFVFEGMSTNCQCELIMFEFHSRNHWGNLPHLPQQEDIMRYLRKLGYVFFISLWQDLEGKYRFTPNTPVLTSQVWGNTICFQNEVLFEKAYVYTKSLMPLSP